jgi:hypothetical protein
MEREIAGCARKSRAGVTRRLPDRLRLEMRRRFRLALLLDGLSRRAVDTREPADACSFGTVLTTVACWSGRSILIERAMPALST